MTRSTRKPASPLLSVRDERLAGAKMAEGVADRIVRDVAALGWPEGHILGSEASLLDRYGVSRAVFREAVRLVEHQQVARMRRGPGGGLVITAPTLDAVLAAVDVYLFYVRATVDEVFHARLVLEEVVAELAPSRLNEDDVGALRDLLARERSGELLDNRALHALLARVTGNPALEFFVDLLNQVSALYLTSRKQVSTDTFSASAHAHRAIADAVLAGDDGLARRRMRKHLEAEADFLRTRSRGRIRLPQRSDGDKRGQEVAFQILADVAAAGWKLGESIGSEADLMERYDVSRAVLREAVRVLEHHQVARMRRGPGGGLFVTEPGVEATTEAIAVHLARAAIAPEHLFEARAAVEMAVLDLVVKNVDDDAVAAMERALESERTARNLQDFVAVGHDLHDVFAYLSGNRVLELLTGVLVRLTRIHQSRPKGMKLADTPIGDVTRTHELIVEAIVDRDADLARLRMRTHLAAMVRWVR